MTTTARFLLPAPVLALGLVLGCSSSPPPESAESASSTESAQGADPANLPKAINAGQVPKNPIIDDLEDTDGQIVVADGRGGYWYTYADASSTVDPAGSFASAEGGNAGSKHAAHMKGKLGTAQYPYVGLGFSFYEPKGPYDLSRCKGIAFSAKKGSATSTGMLRLKVGDVGTVPEAGICKNCYNDFGRDVLLTEEWARIETPFSEMRQEPYWGEPRPGLDTARIYQLQWQVKEPGAEFDIWIDDVELLGCE